MTRPQRFVERRQTQVLAAELEEQRRAIVEAVAPADSSEGLDLMWRFMALADPVYGRCETATGTCRPSSTPPPPISAGWPWRRGRRRWP